MEMFLTLHVLAAVLATWRLTDLVAIDKITEPLRARCSWYVLRCPRCLSVWAGLACTVAFCYLPLLNWPLALAWCYLWRAETLDHRRQQDMIRAENVQLRSVVHSLTQVMKEIA